MNTDASQVQNEADDNQVEVSPVVDETTSIEGSSEGDNNLSQLVEVLQKVESDGPDAEANATSVSDNNGGRIELSEDLVGPNVIKK